MKDRAQKAEAKAGAKGRHAAAACRRLPWRAAPLEDAAAEESNEAESSEEIAQAESKNNFILFVTDRVHPKKDFEKFSNMSRIWQKMKKILVQKLMDES